MLEASETTSVGIAYTISKLMEVMESLERNTMVKAFKRFSPGTEVSSLLTAILLKKLILNMFLYQPFLL